MKRFVTVLMIVFVALGGLSYGGDEDEFTSKKAQIAKKKYEEALEKARKQYLKDLENAKKDAMKKEDLEEANRIKKEEEKIEAVDKKDEKKEESLVSAKDFVGKWEYIYQGKTYIREFTEDGKLILSKVGERFPEWTCSYVVRDNIAVAFVNGVRMVHEIKDDRKMYIEDKYVAEKVKE